nr:hypothetical protein [Tanacetum cinerariifolium]
NSYVKTTTSEEAYAMTWATLKKKMTGEYCPRGEIKKIETEMWNLKDLGLYVPSAIRIMKVLAYLSAITARGLAI